MRTLCRSFWGGVVQRAEGRTRHEADGRITHANNHDQQRHRIANARHGTRQNQPKGCLATPAACELPVPVQTALLASACAVLSPRWCHHVSFLTHAPLRHLTALRAKRRLGIRILHKRYICKDAMLVKDGIEAYFPIDTYFCFLLNNAFDKDELVTHFSKATFT